MLNFKGVPNPSASSILGATSSAKRVINTPVKVDDTTSKPTEVYSIKTPRSVELPTIKTPEGTVNTEPKVEKKVAEGERNHSVEAGNPSTKKQDNPVMDTAAYLKAKGFQVSNIYVPALESDRLTIINPSNSAYVDLYFDLKGKVLFNMPKMVAIDMNLFAQSQMSNGMANPIQVMPLLETQLMLMIDENSIYELEKYLTGQIADLSHLAINPNAEFYELSQFVDLTTAPDNISHEALLKIFRNQDAVYDITSQDSQVRFKVSHFENPNKFVLTSDDTVVYRALQPKIQGISPIITIKYDDGKFEITTQARR